MRYRVQVLATVNHLQYRRGPNTTYRSEGTYQPGESFIVDDQSVDRLDNIWFRNEETGFWCIFRSKTYVNLRIVYQFPEMKVRSVASSSYTDNQSQTITYNGVATTTGYTNAVSNVPAYNNIADSRAKPVEKESSLAATIRTRDVLQQNQNVYPPLIKADDHGKIQYDYRINSSDLAQSVDVIKKNMNIPTLYEPSQVNRLSHTQFNRYKIAYPDYERNALIPYVFFTRPDLNVFDTSGKVLKQFYSRPQLHYLVSSSPQTIKSLTLGFTSAHDFNPILSNRVGSLDVQDDVIDVVETGETFTGYKSQYAKHGIRSITAGQLSIKFPETYNMAITTLHQFWCGYESDVYRGFLDPKEEYIGGKILDYACDIYYFLTDRDGVIRFWTKYFGCFPSNVPKGAFSYDSGSLITFPELNVTYNYIYKEDLSPDTITEFNINAKVNENTTTSYLRDYDASLGHYGTTWVGPPFIQEVFMDEGDGTKSQRFILRFRKAQADSYVDGVIGANVNQNLNNKTVDYNQINQRRNSSSG